ncbi:MAG TPA: iron ABC transporter permease [Alkalispirochaeta sp.]|nr:iron ABC transporter permease [Alkalispirochaeta sp.]
MGSGDAVTTVDDRRRYALFGGLAAFFVLFFLAPVGTVFFRAAGETEAGAAWATVVDILTASRTRSVVTFTVGQASLSAALAVILALPGAYLVSHFTFPGRRIIYSLSLLPFVLPSIIVVVAMIGFYGKSGIINRLLGTDYNLVYNFRGIVLAHVFYNFSLAIRVISTAWTGISRRYRESAESLGDSSRGVFFRVTLPLLLPAILTSFILVFIYCFLSFGVVLVFGGIKYATFEVAIYREMFINLDLPAAAVFALLQILFSGIFIVVSSRFIHRSRAEALDTGTVLPSMRTLPLLPRTVMTGYLIVMVLFVLGPITTMVVRAFTTSAGTLGLENFRQLLVPGAADRNVESILRSSVVGVIGRSLLVAAASGTVTFAAATAAALSLRGRRSAAVDNALQIPIGMSLVTVGLGLRLLWQDALPPVVLIVLGQFFVAFPLVFRIIRSGVEELSDRVVNSAAILGASRGQILRDIEMPLLRRTFLNAYAYALALPFADLTIVMAVGRGRLATFPVAIYRLIGFRSFDLALAMAVLYVAFCLVLFWIIDTTSLPRGSLRSERS